MLLNLLFLSSCDALCARPSLASLAGTPAIVSELQARTAAGESALHCLPEAFPFPLDDFQLDSLDALRNGESQGRPLADSVFIIVVRHYEN